MSVVGYFELGAVLKGFGRHGTLRSCQRRQSGRQAASGNHDARRKGALMITQRDMMRLLVKRHGQHEDIVSAEYAKAEQRGDVPRNSNVRQIRPEEYARMLYADGVRKGWF